MKRLIPLVLLQRGMVVRAENFEKYQKIGNPIDTVRRLSSWSVDELILLERLPNKPKDPYLERTDIELSLDGNGLESIVNEISPYTFMPLTVGGGVESIAQMRGLFSAGADKVCINTAAQINPDLINQASDLFGSQSLVVSIDYISNNDERHVCFGPEKIKTAKDPIGWAIECEKRGAGEILLNNIEHDGSSIGLDNDFIAEAVSLLRVPVIAVGGVGHPDHIVDCFKSSHASAVAVANHFHFTELSYPKAKQHIIENGIEMRSLRLDSHWFPRDPVYSYTGKRDRLATRLQNARKVSFVDESKTNNQPPEVQFCKKCVVPSSSAIPLAFDENGICSACQAKEEIEESYKTSQHQVNQELAELLDSKNSRASSVYDCIIAVSGGKDSYYQTHYVKNVLGLNPLLVTYYGNNFSPEGQANLENMSSAFGVDHIIVKPSVDLLKKLNWLGFAVMGDMNWHNHVGIATLPFQVACEKKIPFVIYGEHGYADLGGQFSARDKIEWTYRHRLEHFARGYDWKYMVGLMGIRERDMSLYRYPSDTELFTLDVRGIFLSNYTVWDGNKNAEIAGSYGFVPSDVASKRTYRRVSNLDDIHENGLHDYLRWIKFGYGRCTDHASKDIRSGLITRNEGVELVKQYDHQVPDDLERWLQYVGVRASTFHRVADTFRDRRVWKPTNKGWIKKNVWDEDRC